MKVLLSTSLYKSLDADVPACSLDAYRKVDLLCRRACKCITLPVCTRQFHETSGISLQSHGRVSSLGSTRSPELELSAFLILASQITMLVSCPFK